jgi:competence protein ComEC
MSKPLLFPLIALMTGIVIGDYFTLPFSLLPAVTLPVLLVLLFLLRMRWNVAVFLFILSLLMITGIFSIQRPRYLTNQPQHIIHQTDHGRLTIEGVVLSSDIIQPDKHLLVVDCRRILNNNTYLTVSGKIRLSAPADLSFQYGDFIRFHTIIKKTQSFQNPGSFDYERYLNRQGIYVTGFVANSAGIILIRHNTASHAKLKLETFRSYLKRIIYDNAPSPQREIIAAMTLGSQKAIPRDVLDNFAKTGTSHILSISGLHIGMVAAGVYFLILILLKSSEYLMLKFNIIKIATAAAFVPVVLYALVAGMGTTVLRATFMTLAILTALLIGKPKEPYNILCAAALIILVIAPESLFDISFQLSFSAVFALLYIVPKFSEPPLPMPPSAPYPFQTFVRRIYIFILVSVAATLGTLPIIVYYFNRISAITLLANMFVVPLLGMLTLFLAMIFLLSALFSPLLAGLLIKAASFCTGIAIMLINWLASLPWSSFNCIKPNIAEIALFYAFIFLLISSVTPGPQHHKEFPARHSLLVKAALIIVLALILADTAYLLLKDKYSTGLNITAIDVGQGASTLVQLPHGVNMLIDGGGFHGSSFDMGKSVIAPFLYSKSIRKIDIVVLTHPHPDHLQGLLHVINNFDVREVWSTGWKTDDDLYRLWEKAITEHRIKTKHLSAQSPAWNVSGVHLQCFWPLRPPDQNIRETSYDETNDSSLVMKITYGTKSFLATGDISSRVEDFLIKSHYNLKSDLLFAPHHGSIHSNSMDFIRAVSCHSVIISAGKNNAFRHPHPDVLERYRSAGVDIFRTDQGGAISISSNGQAINITPWIKKTDP